MSTVNGKFIKMFDPAKFDKDNPGGLKDESAEGLKKNRNFAEKATNKEYIPVDDKKN